MNSDNIVVRILNLWVNMRFEIKARILMTLFFIVVALTYLFWPKKWPSFEEVTLKPSLFVPFILIAFQEILYSLILTPMFCYVLSQYTAAKKISLGYNIASIFIFFYLAIKLNDGFVKGKAVIHLYPYEIVFASFFTTLLFPTISSFSLFLIRTFGLIKRIQGKS